jgi:hypothetical protein
LSVTADGDLTSLAAPVIRLPAGASAVVVDARS